MDIAKLRSLSGSGIFIGNPNGGAASVGRVVLAEVTASGLQQMMALDFVERVELGEIALQGRSLERIAPDINATHVWSEVSAQGLPVTGEGVTVAVHDFGIDIFHPHLFRADAGYYDWVDVDGNGRFDIGTDGIDLNADGLINAGEVIQFIDAKLYFPALGDAPVAGTDDGEFELGWDHLYLDSNSNGTRDFGLSAGFSETTPAYGEPLFLADDVDRDGVIDVGERLVRLGTSKVRAVATSDREWTRGVDLISSRDEASSDVHHGTLVSSLVVGGAPGFTRVTGIAPGADLLVAITDSRSGLSPSLLAWAVGEGADVWVSSVGRSTWTHLDGSTNYELMLAEAAANGLVSVQSAGNLANVDRHAALEVPSGGTASLTLDVPNLNASLVAATGHWRRTESVLRFTVESPDGEIVDLGTAGGAETIAGIEVTGLVDLSPRGTTRFDIGISRFPGGVRAGDWTLHVTDASGTIPAGETEKVFFYVWDSFAEYGRGVSFGDAAVADNVVWYPATADASIAVTAYVGRGDEGFVTEFTGEVGSLRPYGGRGKRIDGEDILDIAAPDNPAAPSPFESLGAGQVDYGSYQVFIGTSSAAPIVGGVAALAKQVLPDATGASIKQMIRDGAVVDEFVIAADGLSVDQLWGAGKVDAYRAVFGQAPALNTPPTIVGATTTAVAGVPFDLPIVVSDAESSASDLTVVADLDYDGTPDVGPQAGDEPLSGQLAEPGVYRVRVQVRDAGGLTAAALVTVTVEPAEEEPGCTCSTSGKEGSWGWLLSVALWFPLLRRQSRPLRTEG